MRRRIIKYLSIIFFLFTIGGLASLLIMEKVTSDLSTIISLHRVETLRQDLIINLNTVQNNLFTVGTEFGPEVDVIVKNVLTLDRSLRRCQSCHHSEEMTRRFSTIRRLLDRYEDALSSFITISANPDRVKLLQEVAAEIGEDLLAQTREMTFIAHQKLQEQTERAIKTVNILKAFLMLVLFGSMCIGLVAAFRLTDRIVKPIQRLKEASEEIASGNLGVRVNITDETEIGILANTFNKMSNTLKEEREMVMRYMSRLKGLHRITLTLHMVTDRKDLIEEFVEGLYDVILTKGIYLYLMDDKSDHYKLAYKAIEKKKGISFPETCETSKVNYIYELSNKKAKLFNGSSNEVANCFQVQGDLRNLLVLWLRQRDRLFGFVIFANISEQENIEENIRVLSIIANNFVVALENIQLYEDLRAQMAELKQTQEQLVQAAKLAAIGELAAIVAHELNNPLTTILGYAELLKEEELPEPIKEELTIIESESLRARDIVRQLLEFSRKKPLQLQPTDLNELLEETIRFIEPNLSKLHIKLEKKYQSQSTVNIDRDQFKQVFLNLINNAIQAMPEGGTLKITTLETERNIFVEVADTGEGIPEDILPRIFEPFFTTKKDKGTGLGLSITYRIIRDHGGDITVESEPGKGTVFKVVIPKLK